MKTHLSFLIIFGLFFIAFEKAQAFQCVDFEIEIKNGNSNKIITPICFNKSWDFYSIKCQLGQCLKIKRSTLKESQFHVNTQISSPGFSLCRQVGGTPNFITIKNPKLGTHKTSWCAFDHNSNFLSMDNLIKIISSQSKNK